MDEQIISAEVRAWVQHFVIGLNLCPFAGRELQNDRVRFTVAQADSQELLLQTLQHELEILEADPSIETTLLIHPNVLQDFSDYNQFLDLADALIDELDMEGVYQVASFHPDYQFADTKQDDAENFTNRSPYPLLHLIREASLARVIAATPDIDQVPARNIVSMNEMGTDKLKALLRSCMRVDQA